MSENKAWICTVCGYVHNGPEPPDVCPVCGATKDLFEPYGLPAPAPAAKSPAEWRCLNCEYVHQGPEPPQVCPVCGAPAERFEPHEQAPATVPSLQQKHTIVIVGAGIAGVSAAEAARKSAPEAEIHLLSKEPDLPYYRLNLTRYLAGEVKADQLVLHPREWYESNGIRLRLNMELCSIDSDRKQLRFRNDDRLDYDKLILTIGSHAFLPPFPGANKENVTVLRTRKDADFILEQCKAGIRCVIIGGGVLGLEAAGALSRQDIDVTLLEGHDWLMPRQLNEKAARLLEAHASSLGIRLQKNARTREIAGDERAREVILEDGTSLPAELVIISTGVRSNSYIARLAGMEVNRGIVVNNRLQTSNPDIYAAGDAAEHRGVTYGLWGPSQFQGTIAGMNAAGGEAEFAGIPRSNMLKVLGYDMFSIGQIAPEDASYRVFESEKDGVYFFFMFRDSRLVGSMLLGDTGLSSRVKTMVEKGTDCSEILKKTPDADDIVKRLEDLAG